MKYVISFEGKKLNKIVTEQKFGSVEYTLYQTKDGKYILSKYNYNNTYEINKYEIYIGKTIKKLLKEAFENSILLPNIINDLITNSIADKRALKDFLFA